MIALKKYKAPGKLLITGEYLILEGAEGLAVPLNLGQSLTVKNSETQNDVLTWKAETPAGEWFSGTFSLPDFKVLNATDTRFAKQLTHILIAVRKLNSGFLLKGDWQINTCLEFNSEYGFGSSSTLIANLARWADVDAFELQKQTFNGSGYDVAVALENAPIIYKLENGRPDYRKTVFKPSFTQHLFFVYLGKKQQSLHAIKQFKKNAIFTSTDIQTVTSITRQITVASSLREFEQLLHEHEKLMSGVLKTPPVQQLFFANYKQGVVKSLGAWGGDFVLVTTTADKKTFETQLKKLGFAVVYSYDELVAP